MPLAPTCREPGMVWRTSETLDTHSWMAGRDCSGSKDELRPYWTLEACPEAAVLGDLYLPGGPRGR